MPASQPPPSTLTLSPTQPTVLVQGDPRSAQWQALTLQLDSAPGWLALAPLGEVRLASFHAFPELRTLEPALAAAAQIPDASVLVLAPNGAPLAAFSGAEPHLAEGVRSTLVAWDRQPPESRQPAPQLQAALSSPLPPPLELNAMQLVLSALPSEIPAGRAGLSTAELMLALPEPPADLLGAWLDGLMTQGHVDLLGGGLFGMGGRKTLADNARLLQIAAATASLTGEQRHAALARSTADYILRDLRAPKGGFWAGEAPSEHGSFYAWDPVEVEARLGGMAAPLMAAVTFDEAGWMRAQDPGLLSDPQVREALLLLFGARLERLPPPTDTARPVADNALLLRALASSGALLGEPSHLEAARELAEVLLAAQTDAGAPRTLAGGKGRLEDHALLGAGLLALYEAAPQTRWLLGAQAQVAGIQAHAGPGGLHQGTLPFGDEGPVYATRDGELPSGWGEALILLHRLEALGAPGIEAGSVDALLQPASGAVEADLLACGALSRAALELRQPVVEVVIASAPGDPALPFWIASFHSAWRPGIRLAVQTGEPELEAFGALSGKTPGVDGPRAYICVGEACGIPSSTLEGFQAALDRLGHTP